MTIFSTRNIILFFTVSLICAGVAFFAFRSNMEKPNQDHDHSKSQNISEAGDDSDEKYEEITSKVLKVSDLEFALGNKDAKVTIIDYASMSCPHCAAFYEEAFEELKEEYIDTGKVRFVYRDFPLNHPSLVAAMLAICRASEFEEKDRAQGYHDFVKVMYNTQNSWIFKNDYAEKLESIAILEGMNKDLIKQCLSDAKFQDQILQARMIAVKELEIQSTPTFFINNKRIQGFPGYEKIKELIDYELNK